MNLKIASLNVRGIGNNAKRKEVFNWLRSKKFFGIHAARSPLFR